MIKQTYLLQLASPAFLGGADQRGSWRTPPLKALIREWWRIAVAPELGYEHRQMKQHETRLFGTLGALPSRTERLAMSYAHP